MIRPTKESAESSRRGRLDSSKFGRTAFAHIGELSIADILITECTPAPEIGAALAEAGVELLIPR